MPFWCDRKMALSDKWPYLEATKAGACGRGHGRYVCPQGPRTEAASYTNRASDTRATLRTLKPIAMAALSMPPASRERSPVRTGLVVLRKRWNEETPPMAEIVGLIPAIGFDLYQRKEAAN